MTSLLLKPHREAKRTVKQDNRNELPRYSELIFANCRFTIQFTDPYLLHGYGTIHIELSNRRYPHE